MRRALSTPFVWLGPAAAVTLAACGAALAGASLLGIAGAALLQLALVGAAAWMVRARILGPLRERLAAVDAQASETAEVNARLAAAIEQAAEAVMMTDIDGRILYVNPAFERITGFPAAEAVGSTPAILKAERADPAIHLDLWQTILRGQVWRSEITNRRRDGTPFTWEEAITPVRDERGRLTHFIAMGQDVSVQRQLQAQLLQAQKMEAVGRLAGGVAHDFNNLLTVITGYSEQLLMRLATHDPLRRKAESIRGAAERASSLTQQLLAFSRRQAHKPRVLDLNHAVVDLARLLRRLIGEDVELVTHLSADRVRVKADPMQLEQVLMNLAVNARDAMPQGGILRLETEAVTLEGPSPGGHTQMPAGEYVRLTVSDTGCGMDEETRKRLFEPFFTTKEPGKGTGLGLSTVYGIVKQSGGFIWVESAVGHGSVFKIYLPLATEAVDMLAVPAGTTRAPHGTETILVVEDDAEVRALLKDSLQQCGYTVLDASNGGEALLFCERYSGPIHVVITDVVMPHMDGYEVAERLCELRPGLRTLFISGYADRVPAHHRQNRCQEVFLAKPFTPEMLAQRVRQVLAVSAAA